jgi:aspartate ammonia-lyase
VLKMGRTQLQDAVPMTLGQEFTAFAVTIGEDIERLREASALIREINLGATAIGTGHQHRPALRRAGARPARAITGLELVTAPDLVEATQDTGAFVQLSGVLKRVAVKLSKICNDLRLLSSGPRAGLNEINLPPMQPGSSIMPGKVNPVIPEVVNQICFQVVGNDLTITMAAEAGQLQLNVFEPVIGFNLFQSVDMLTRGAVVLRERCVLGITRTGSGCCRWSTTPSASSPRSSPSSGTSARAGWRRRRCRRAAASTSWSGRRDGSRRTGWTRSSARRR